MSYANHVMRVYLLRTSTLINPCLANVSILYPLKTPENLWYSGIFRGYKMEKLARYELNW